MESSANTQSTDMTLANLQNNIGRTVKAKLFTQYYMLASKGKSKDQACHILGVTPSKMNHIQKDLGESSPFFKEGTKHKIKQEHQQAMRIGYDGYRTHLAWRDTIEEQSKQTPDENNRQQLRN